MIFSSFFAKIEEKVEEGKFQKFFTMLKNLVLNILLVEALEKMPDCVKFIHNLVTKKRMVSYESIDNVHCYSVIASRSLVTKKDDLRAFTIPCTIRVFNFAKALCDLGDNIKLMPLEIYK